MLIGKRSGYCLFFVLFIFGLNPLEVWAGSFAEILRGEAGSATTQDSTYSDKEMNVIPLKQAGGNLLWSRNLYYGANILGYMGSFIKGGTIFSILSTGSSVAADYNVGMAGSRLKKFGRTLHPDIGFKVEEAGGYLQTYRTLSMISTGTSLAGSIFLMNALDENASDEELLQGVGIALGISIAAITLKYFAVGKIEKAGKLFGDYAKTQKTKWKKYYLSQSAEEMTKFTNNWKRGFGLVLMGGALMLAGGVTGSPEVARIGVITGGITMLIGHVYMAWVAPANLGSAGNNYESFEERLRNSSD